MIASIIKGTTHPFSMQYHPISVYPEPYECCDAAEETVVVVQEQPPLRQHRTPPLVVLFGLNLFGLNPQIAKDHATAGRRGAGMLPVGLVAPVVEDGHVALSVGPAAGHE